MFHIKPDKRSRTSAELIVGGLYACLAVKPFSGISISDLQRASSVGRATFYRLFDTVTDVLEYECDKVFRNMLQAYRAQTSDGEAGSAYERLFSCFFEYWMGHVSLLDALSDSGRVDIMHAVYRAHTGEIRDILVPDMTLTERELDYFVSVATAVIFGVFDTWVKGGRKESREELLYNLKRSVAIAAASLKS